MSLLASTAFAENAADFLFFLDPGLGSIKTGHIDRSGQFKATHEAYVRSSRLLTNCIIVYNMTLLSKLLVLKERTGDQAGAAMLLYISSDTRNSRRYFVHGDPVPLLSRLCHGHLGKHSLDETSAL